jgi:hypothetical protein
MDMDRIDYMQMAAYCLSEEDCIRLFDRTKDEMLDGSAVWNQSLECAYNDYINNQ